jgi:hypothetical protein
MALRVAGARRGDAVSDLDVWVVVHDDALPAIRTDAYAVPFGIGDPLYVLEAPYNGPLGGTSLNTAFDGEQTGAHLVDWYFQPASIATRPPQLRLLFDRAGLPISDEPAPYGNPDRGRSETADTVQKVRFFWQMLLICAKYAYRSPNEERMGLLVYAVNALNDVRRFVGQPFGADANELPAHPAPAEKLALLRSLADDMTACMPTVARIAEEQGEDWRISPTILPSARRFLTFIEGALTPA